MYKKLSKFLSTVISLLITFSAVQPAFFSISALAADTASLSYGDLVPVIVKVKGDAVMTGEQAAENGLDFIETEDAAVISNRIGRNQKRAENYLKSIYPDLEIGYRYSLLFNGFSCQLPENLIETAKTNIYIEEINKTGIFEKEELAMANVSSLTGVDYVSDLGYYGEGEVIAILDTEIDTTHPAFSPIDNKKFSLSKQDVATAVNSGVLSSEMDADRVYINSKLPFVYDYSDSTPYEYWDSANYHGTHVAGIAAGNYVEEDSFSGVARDAQILLMKVFGDENDSGKYTAFEDVAIAALEDAVKLKADVINMSLGGTLDGYEPTFYSETINALENAGVVLCASAGNNGNTIKTGDIHPDNVDVNTIRKPSIYPTAFCVASADNVFSEQHSMVLNGEVIKFMEVEYSTINTEFGNEFEYVYCDKFCDKFFDNNDVKGKLLLMEYNADVFIQDIDQFSCRDIAGIVFYSTMKDSLENIISPCSIYNSIFISSDDGIKMKNADVKKVYIYNEETEFGECKSKISFFSSFGVPSTLDLKPDITGIGGCVRSAGYDSDYKYLDGTSMSSPNVAGCSAILDEYLKKNGVSLNGSEKSALIKNLLMNTAVPYFENGHFVSPRHQGAGLVALDFATESKVVATGDTNQGKIILNDKIGDEFSFTLNLQNFSDEDVVFDNAEIYLTTDGYLVKPNNEKFVYDTVSLNCTSDLKGRIYVPKGEKVEKTITVKLDSEQTAKNLKTFTNGFFVEGYVVLSNAGNSSNISVPMLGYYGDWQSIPIFESDKIGDGAFNSSFGENYFRQGYSLAELSKKIEEMISGKSFDYVNPSASPVLTEDEYDELLSMKYDDIYLSAYGNGIFDLSIFQDLNRNAYYYFSIIDSEGNTVKTSMHNYTEEWFIAYLADLFDNLSDLDDGRYTVCDNAYICYGDKKTQTASRDIIIDSTLPELVTEFDDKNNTAKIIARDENLEGVYITGKKRSSGSSASAKIKSLAEAIGIMSYSTLDNLNLSFDSPVIASLNYSNAKPLEKYDYFEFYSANGEQLLEIEADLSDLYEYEILVTDKAYNNTTEKYTKDEYLSMLIGDWWIDGSITLNGFFEFAIEELYYHDMTDGKCINTSYILNDNQITFTINDKIYSGVLNSESDDRFIITTENGEVIYFYSVNNFKSDYFTDNDIIESITNYSIGLYGNKPEKIEIYNSGYQEAVVDIMLPEGEKSYYIDRFSGQIYLDNGDEIMLQDYKNLPCGYWSFYCYEGNNNISEDYIFYIESANSGKVISLEDRKEIHFTFDFNMANHIFEAVDENGINYNGNFYRYHDSNSGLLSVFSGDLIFEGDLSFISSSQFVIYTNQELIDMAVSYYNSVNTIKAESAELSDHRIILYDENGTELIRYFVNRFSMSAEDIDGTPVDIFGNSHGIVLGDANKDGIIDAVDASQILSYYALSSVLEIEIESDVYQTYDVNLDGAVDATDASTVLSYYAYSSVLASNAEQISLSEFITRR